MDPKRYLTLLKKSLTNEIYLENELRLDGDLYESTMDALVALYDKVVPGGFIIVDDYGDFAPCRRAIHEFREQRGITDPITPIDWTGVFWRKGGEVRPTTIGDTPLISTLEPP